MTGAALAALDLTPPQLRALEAISDHQPLNQTQLGELVNMDRSTIVHVIDHFEALGVAARHAEPSDRRTHAVMLTPSGKHLLARARASARAVEDQFLAPLSQTQRAALQNTLQQLFDPSPCPEEKKRESRTPPSHPR